MANFSTNNLQAGTQQALTSSFQTVVSLTASAANLKRAAIYDILVGSDGTLSGTSGRIVFDWSRQSTVGTGSTATPNPLDSADTAAATVSTVNETVEPTIGASVLTFALYQKNSMRWRAKDAKAALIVPATDQVGIAGRAMATGYTGTVVVTQMFAE